MEDLHFRHEFKYIQPETVLTAMEKRLQVLMKRDPHLFESTGYEIRSVYFDDASDSFLQDNIDGVDCRKKWRIRVYDRSSDHISLECKMRKSDLIAKKSCLITPDIWMRIINKKADINPSNPALLNVFIKEMKTSLLSPKVVVEYERTPFVSPLGNTRVTIDRKIRSSFETDALLADRPLLSRPVLPSGMNLVEVKFDGFLPDHIAHCVENGRMRRETFSKYFLARRFAYDGGIL